ncbi:lycopene cyclase domain-containing protein [Microbacterium sp. P26]|uniref:lycopene cyclase domain-containing protein n=1 Tax=Microbacterium TaxID=33882 RepID=UPI0020400732|nr:lycopene cyclase domain-containing protein [Microbacterium sp. P26]MCM3503417.1 lycopene cyclase domain-containing protein [Microbacterium sp. P26]
MPGIYLGAILFSLIGMMLIDGKYSLALRVAPLRTALAVLGGTVFFLAWDLVGIATGVFVKGESPLFVGVMLAPHLPLEELFFLLFLSYLAIVMFAVFERRSAARSAAAASDARGSSSAASDARGSGSAATDARGAS